MFANFIGIERMINKAGCNSDWERISGIAVNLNLEYGPMPNVMADLGI